MTRFVQLHILTVYPPSNLNRDDVGAPKTALFGGTTRLRISSQALKRAWRTSNAFETSLEGHLGERTQRLGRVVFDHLTSTGSDEAAATSIAREIAGLLGKIKMESEPNGGNLFTEQLAFVSPDEKVAAIDLAEQLRSGQHTETLKASAVLRHADGAVDIAMFGRMMAGDPEFNRDAAVQVAHAITTHSVVVEDDYYTAVDDLKKPSEDAGAGFIGEAGFGSGVFYLYICIDTDLLTRNLAGNEALARDSVKALLEAAITVSPGGKQASFASRANASYLMAERGNDMPRTLASAFIGRMGEEDYLQESVNRLRETRHQFEKAYGIVTPFKDAFVREANASFTEIVDFAVAW
jgi:CRISPR system Cascade subunit CasC